MKPFLRLRWLRLALLAVLLLVPLVLLGPGAAGAAGQDPPDPPGGPQRGQEAIDSLGSRLPEVAAAYGMAPAELHALFLSDHTLHVSNSGELFYADDPFPADEASSLAEQTAPATAPFPDEQTFLLHSRPGADHTIYLDFDGHVTEGTTWNSAYRVTTILSPPYDIDGDPDTFNATEIDRIQKTWQIVAEDFSPFDINVTTQDPGPAALSYQGGGDTQWGTRVVITDDTFANCRCGGHAYIGSFDDSQDEPVFVYNTSLAGVAEASSHEVGHAINLSHDGTSTSTYYWGHGSGATSWAPIMGASYNTSVSHWSKGEYYDANNGGSNANYGAGPDDLAIITSLSNGNGFGYRPDDHGDSSQAATPLAANGTAVSGSGVVERTDDVDVFSFATGAGQVTLSILPAVQKPNLDILVELYDGNWNLIAVSNSDSILSASLNATLDQGIYYLTVDGTGSGNPFSSSPTGYTEYGSLGQYDITGTIVDNNNDAPAFSNDPLVKADATEDAAYNGTLAGDASDPDGDPLTFSKVSGPAWLTIAANGALAGTPTNDDVGPNGWTVQVADDLGGVDQATLQITVINTNDPPAFNSDPIIKGNATYDEAYNGTLAGDASDPDGDTLTYSKVSGPAWLNVAGDGTFLGTPTDTDLGLNTWTVQVDDGNNSADLATLEITVVEPVLFIDFVATGELFVSGTVAGSYFNTQADDSSVEAITEKKSGGKPSNRYSFLEHKWVFSVQAGTSMELRANAWAASTDGDTFMLAYSSNDNSYTDLGVLTAATDDGNYQMFILPASLNGTVFVRLEDTNRVAGQMDMDTVYVDHLYIRSHTQPLDPPAAPSVLGATAAGASQIDLDWIDNADNEAGFTVERSPDGANDWAEVGVASANVTTFSDTGPNPETTYDYRVRAHNGGGVSGYSNVATATTASAGSMHVGARTSATSAAKGRWSATVTITIVDHLGAPVANATVSGVWSAGANGGATCNTDAWGECDVSRSNLKSNVPSVTFAVTDVQHAANSYVAGDNVITSLVVNSP